MRPDVGARRQVEPERRRARGGGGGGGGGGLDWTFGDVEPISTRRSAEAGAGPFRRHRSPCTLRRVPGGVSTRGGCGKVWRSSARRAGGLCVRLFDHGGLSGKETRGTSVPDGGGTSRSKIASGSLPDAAKSAASRNDTVLVTSADRCEIHGRGMVLPASRCRSAPRDGERRHPRFSLSVVNAHLAAAELFHHGERGVGTGASASAVDGRRGETGTSPIDAAPTQRRRVCDRACSLGQSDVGRARTLSQPIWWISGRRQRCCLRGNRKKLPTK